MVFSTPIFLFYFLVLTLLVYYLVPRKLRNGVLDQTKKVCRDRPDLFFFPKTWEEAEALIPRLLKENRG